MGTKNDKVILSLKKQIEEKKKLLSEITKFSPITNCSLELDGVRYNIHTQSKENLLLLVAKINSLKKSLYAMLPEESLIISGYRAEDWLEDLVLKFKTLNTKLEKERLSELEKKLTTLLTNETRVSLELDDLKNQI